MNKITKQNGTLLVPDKVVIPFIEGDGVGAEITPVCQRIVDEAVGRAYGGQRVIEWKKPSSRPAVGCPTRRWRLSANI